MVSCEKILEAAVTIDADIIGLSGLINLSLDEMVHVASEMRKKKFKTALLLDRWRDNIQTTYLVEDRAGIWLSSHSLTDASRGSGSYWGDDVQHRHHLFIRSKKIMKKFEPATATPASKKKIMLIDARKNKMKIGWENFTLLLPSKRE